MKIVFLDVDGVLNGTKLGREVQGNLVRRLETIILACSAEIVLTSNWRFSKQRLPLLSLALSQVGLTIHQHTPDLMSSPANHDADHGLLRGKEIQTWLRENAELVTKWVVIDDWDLGSTSPWLVPHFVHTNPTLGISLSL
eukprot:c26944_g1_i1.p1 GENE.c26944_g1_i1~~c26944_g1_i1.p1  ORF type:complete len:140 (+),score=28.17 c26944_g1_i1:34-453(+)